MLCYAMLIRGHIELLRLFLCMGGLSLMIGIPQLYKEVHLLRYN